MKKARTGDAGRNITNSMFTLLYGAIEDSVWGLVRNSTYLYIQNLENGNSMANSVKFALKEELQ